jgi:hypothetical protein
MIILEGFLYADHLPLNWDPTIKGTWRQHSAFVAAGALNMITDIMVLLLLYLPSESADATGKQGRSVLFCTRSLYDMFSFCPFILG